MKIVHFIMELYIGDDEHEKGGRVGTTQLCSRHRVGQFNGCVKFDFKYVI